MRSCQNVIYISHLLTSSWAAVQHPAASWHFTVSNLQPKRRLCPELIQETGNGQKRASKGFMNGESAYDISRSLFNTSHEDASAMTLSSRSEGLRREVWQKIGRSLFFFEDQKKTKLPCRIRKIVYVHMGINTTPE